MSALPDAGLLAPGFRDPVHGAQRAFRRLLDAMAHPGRIHDLSGLLAASPPAPLGEAAAAVLLALCDIETPLWLPAAAASVLPYLAFHRGMPVAAAPEEGRFAFVPDPALLPPLAGFGLGSDEYPDRSTTLVLEVKSLGGKNGVSLGGPGIESRARLAAGGFGGEFWRQRQELAALFPRGLDICFTCGARLAALPRSTKVEIA
ncbi:MAG TPA: phosphonate C-P lyase system protein PhnH [Stellaceae bacterium]|nr:phosphonate C-P lyase system protein PhnH [Stellaceae bacterium]